MEWVDETVKLVFSNVSLPIGVTVSDFIIDKIQETKTKYENTIEILEYKELHEMCEFEEIHMNLDRLNMALQSDSSKELFVRKSEEYMRLKTMDAML